MPRLIDQHKQVYTLRPTKPERSGKKKPSDRKFKLSWQGSTAPDTSFRLEHSRDGGETWSAVKGADELGKSKFKIDEKPGTWIYKVRSSDGCARGRGPTQLHGDDAVLEAIHEGQGQPIAAAGIVALR